jgi:hypothetical protein
MRKQLGKSPVIGNEMPARLRSPFLTAETNQLWNRLQNRSTTKKIRFQTKIESAIRYLGIEVDDALAIAEQVGV